MKKITLLIVLCLSILVVEAQTYTFDQTTYSSSAVATTWGFNNNCTISNINAKAYSTGTSPYVKFSAGVVFTITFPSAITINSVQFSGYDNYAGKRSYISDFNGVANTDSTVNFFPAKNPAAIIATNTITPSSPIVSNTLTFTITGNQTVLQIVVNPTSTLLEEAIQTNDNTPTNIYTIEGKVLRKDVVLKDVINQLKNGIYIVNNKKVVVSRN